MNRRMFLGAAAIVAAADRLVAQPGGTGQDEAEVRQAESTRFNAMLKADVAVLDRVLAPELTYTHGDGRVIDKAAFIADFKTGAFKYLMIEPNAMNVRLYGSTAVVTGGAAMRVEQNGKPADIRIRYTNVQVKRNGTWQMVAWQATRLMAP